MRAAFFYLSRFARNKEEIYLIVNFRNDLKEFNNKA